MVTKKDKVKKLSIGKVLYYFDEGSLQVINMKDLKITTDP